MTEACDLSAREARRLIGMRRLSPVELVESCLARIGRIDPAVNAVVALDEARALAAAREAEAAVAAGGVLGTLHGLPIGVKDLEDTRGLRTTYGSVMFRDNVPASDQGVVASIREAGGIVLGKTNTPEFGAGANTINAVYGATGNPFDNAKSPAGSSGGSAAALATGMVPLATGSDMGGSCRNPAAWCGIAGMRPSPGLVPSEKRQLGLSPLSVIGPMARSADDLALFLGAMAACDVRDAWSVPRALPDFARLPSTDPGTLRVAFTDDFGVTPTSRAVREAFAAKMTRLAPLFGACAETTPDCTGADDSFAVLRAVSFLAAYGETFRTHPGRLGPNVRANVEEGLGYSAGDVARAEAAQTVLARRWHEFFGHHDLIIAPAVTLPPFAWTTLYPAEIDGVATRSYYHWLALAYVVTLAGHPAIALPLGTDSDGMPFGIQIIGRRHGDAALLAAAIAIEAALAGDSNLGRPSPDLEALATAQPIRDMQGFFG